MKLKDLPKSTPLRGVKVRATSGNAHGQTREGYFWSNWGYENGGSGVWIKPDLDDGRIIPITFETFKEYEDTILDWEVVQ